MSLELSEDEDLSEGPSGHQPSPACSSNLALSTTRSCKLSPAMPSDGPDLVHMGFLLTRMEEALVGTLEYAVLAWTEWPLCICQHTYLARRSLFILPSIVEETLLTKNWRVSDDSLRPGPCCGIRGVSASG